MLTEEQEICTMQCWIFRMAQKKWKLSSSECAEVFRKYSLMDVIRDNYGMFHLSGYDTVLAELTQILKAKQKANG